MQFHKLNIKMIIVSLKLLIKKITINKINILLYFLSPIIKQFYVIETLSYITLFIFIIGYFL